MHIMDAAVFSRLSAAVALSELALTSPSNQLPEKREVSTQTDSSIPDLWLNTVQEETSNLVSKVSPFYKNAVNMKCPSIATLLSRSKTLARKRRMLTSMWF